MKSEESFNNNYHNCYYPGVDLHFGFVLFISRFKSFINFLVCRHEESVFR